MWRPSSSKICDAPCWFWMVGWVHAISLFGLHSLIWMRHEGITCGGGICIVSLICASSRFDFKMLIKY